MISSKYKYIEQYFLRQEKTIEPQRMNERERKRERNRKDRERKMERQRESEKQEGQIDRYKERFNRQITYDLDILG